ncbi:MAG TPA: efflux RND transporter periplasmic adaptor subunit [bacterium]|nr:efflux RND transporter periplasmic adaptor subunit [bacterium]
MMRSGWILLIGAVAFSAACSGAGDKKPVRPPPLVQVTPVSVRDVPVEVKAPVDLRALAQADLSSKTQGYLDAVLVDRGDRVKKGQLVAVVRPSDLPDQLAAARGALANAEAQAQLAQANWDRVQQLAPAGVVSQQELQAAQAQHDATQAQANAARAQVAALATRYGETRIESPMDGVVVDRRLDPGALVGNQGSSAVILTIARMDTLRAFVGVNERDAQDVKVDLPAHVDVDALGGKSAPGKVVRIAPSFDPVTRTLDAEIQLPNPDGQLRPGMYGRGAITVGVHPNAIVAPVEAVQISNQKPYVFVVEADNTAHRHAIRVGVDGGEWFEVTDGLKAGDRVVIAGQDALADGMKVRLPSGPEPTASAPGSSSAAVH